MVVEDSNSEKPLDLFLKIGLDDRTARNTMANNKVTANLTAVIHEVLYLYYLIFSSLAFVNLESILSISFQVFC